MRTPFLAFLLFLIPVLDTLADSDISVVVGNGKKNQVVEVGHSWTEQNGALCGMGTGNFLYADRKIGEGDFVIEATLTLERLDRTAASLSLGIASQFGLDVADGFFTEGPLFGTSYRIIPDSLGLITPGRPFDIRLSRIGTTLSAEIDGKHIYKRTVSPERPIGTVAIRPHRNRIRVHAFSLRGNLSSLEQSDLHRMKGELLLKKGADHIVLFQRGRDYNNIRIPAICRTTSGTLLAFAEGRTRGDADKIELILRRSVDGGKTWSPTQVIWKDGENTCGNPAPVVDMETGVIWLLTTWNYGPDIWSTITKGISSSPRRCFLMKSNDDGITWSEAKEQPHLRRDDWGWCATGPCNGIQLTRGPRRGRLVVGGNHSVLPSTPGLPMKGVSSHLLYSDDHGETWQIGGPFDEQTDESTVAELEDGSIMQNMRSNHKKGCRAVRIAAEGGDRFTPLFLEHALKTPVCQGSLIRYRWPEEGGGILLFSSPFGSEREKLSVWMSKDDGKTWPIRKLLFDGPAAYSNLIVLPNHKVGLLAEIGSRSPYDTIAFIVFDLHWLESEALIEK